MDVRGRGALITGASRGLGEALARRLARDGARVALVARGTEELERVAASIRAAGGDAHALPGDVGDPEAAARLAGAAAALVGPIDLLVNNASTLGPTPLPALLDLAPGALEEVLAVNVVGPWRLTRAVAGSMALRGGGLVLNLSSDAAVSAYAGWGAYSASKAALDQLGRVWAAELDAAGVKFLSVDPGEMDTRMHADAMPDADRAALARPAETADRLATLVRRAESLPGGARLEAAKLEAGSEARP